MIQNRHCRVLLLAIAFTATARAEEVILTAAEMDTVTAGTEAAVTVNAEAAADIYALTHTSAVAVVHQTANKNPVLRGHAAFAGGLASTTTVGRNASSNTSVNPTTSAPSGNALNYTVSADMQVGIVHISGSMIATFSSPWLGPFM